MLTLTRYSKDFLDYIMEHKDEYCIIIYEGKKENHILIRIYLVKKDRRYRLAIFEDNGSEDTSSYEINLDNCYKYSFTIPNYKERDVDSFIKNRINKIYIAELKLKGYCRDLELDQYNIAEKLKLKDKNTKKDIDNYITDIENKMNKQQDIIIRTVNELYGSPYIKLKYNKIRIKLEID